MAGNKDPHRFAGKMGINKGPIPINRWVVQPTVNASAPKQDKGPDAGSPQKQGNGTRKGKQ